MGFSITSIIVIIFVVSILMGLLYSLITLSRKKQPSGRKYNKHGKPGDKGVCPICRTILSPGEQVTTAVYPGEDDQLCYIYGCPYCYPVAGKDTDRICPVCKKELGGEAHLYARYFNRRDSSQHIHILGCTKCRLKR